VTKTAGEIGYLNAINMTYFLYFKETRALYLYIVQISLFLLQQRSVHDDGSMLILMVACDERIQYLSDSLVFEDRKVGSNAMIPGQIHLFRSHIFISAKAVI
jgi:hypothetical protein